MQLRTGGQYELAWRRQQHQLVRSLVIQGIRTGTRILAHLLGRSEPVAVGLIGIEASGIIVDIPGKGTHVESHGVTGLDVKHRKPPVDLLCRSGIPRVAVPGKGEGDSGGAERRRERGVGLT